MCPPQTTAGRPTQIDVARRAGVSQPLVSYVLGGADAPVAPETRERVLAAIADLGYVPDRTARNLRRRRTTTIAGIIPDITNPYYPAFVRGVQDVAETHGFDLITYNTDGQGEKERAAFRSAREARVAGMIVASFHLELDDLSPLVADGIALVVTADLGIYPIPVGIDQLFVDNAAAAAAAVGYLMDRGHTRIGMIAGEEVTPPRDGRLRGYARALRGRAIPRDAELIRHGEFTVEGGYAGAGDLLKLDRRPTALFAANDLMAMGAMLRFREAGLRVPDDIAVVGFDDIPAARLVHPPLTTVAQHPERIGRRAAEMVVERLAGTGPTAARREVQPFELVVRESA